MREFINKKDTEQLQKKVKTWLIPSIILTAIVFPMNVFGITALVFSIITIQKKQAGDTKGAQRASRIAKIFVIISTVILGIIASVLLFCVAIVLFNYAKSGGRMFGG